jgi:hypothetical protein
LTFKISVRSIPLGVHASMILAAPGHTILFIARQTRAYLNFEVKDAPKARGLRPSMILEFKVQIRFSAAER